MMAVCLTPTGCITAVADTFWGQLADALRDAAGQMVTTLFGWWTATPSYDVDTPVVHTSQEWVTTWGAVPIAVLALVAAVAWGVAAGSHAWIADAARGLFVFGIVATGSLPLVKALQDWSTSLARGLLSAVPSHDVGNRVLTLLDLPGAPSLFVAFWAVVMLIIAGIQYVLMLFRDGAVLVLAAVLPVAAAGQFARGSVLWLPRVVGWLLAFVFMKPAAALIYFIGLSLLGQADGVQALATAVCVMVAATLALPALMKLVTFTLTAPQLSGAGLATAATVTGIATSIVHATASQRMVRGPQGAAPAAATAATAASGPATPMAKVAVEGAAQGQAVTAQARNAVAKSSGPPKGGSDD